jgi:hypothetical protein
MSGHEQPAASVPGAEPGEVVGAGELPGMGRHQPPRTVSRGRENGVALAPHDSESQVMETMTVLLTLTEEEAHGLRDILDWLDIHEPAEFTEAQLAGLQKLLLCLGRNQIRRFFDAG